MNYENKISTNQNLTFDDLGENITSTIFTNYDLLISDQCLHSIKIIKGELDKPNAENRKEIKGSLIKQFKQTLEYLEYLNTNTHASSRKREKRNYPIEAIRESLINAIIHRDYEQPGSILVKVYNDRIEIISIGGILGLSLEAIKAGVSQTRNPKLAEKFYNLKLTNDCGSGINKIFASYEKYNKKPKIETTNEYFKITLPNVNFQKEETDIINEKIIDNNISDSNASLKDEIKYHIEKKEIATIKEEKENEEKMKLIFSLPERQQKILETLKNGSKTRKEIQNILSIRSQTKTSSFLKKLIDLNLVERKREGKNITYRKI